MYRGQLCAVLCCNVISDTLFVYHGILVCVHFRYISSIKLNILAELNEACSQLYVVWNLVRW